MSNFKRLRPSELLYINLSGMEPFVDNMEIPKAKMEREKKKISTENNASTLLEVIFEKISGKYLIVGGYTTFHAYHDLNPNRIVLCKAYYHLSEAERYILTINWMMENKINNWYKRHEIITKLVFEFKYTVSELATLVNKQKRNIQHYLDPPPNIKNEALRQRKESIINKVYLESFKNEHNKEYLYILILYLGFNITQEQLKFIGWIRGNNIKFEECQLTLEQEHQLINKSLNLKEDFLSQIRMMINEMQISNGDKPN